MSGHPAFVLCTGDDAKLCWNKGDDADDIAAEFVVRHSLPLSELPDIAVMILEAMGQGGGEKQRNKKKKKKGKGGGDAAPAAAGQAQGGDDLETLD